MDQVATSKKAAVTIAIEAHDETTVTLVARSSVKTWARRYVIRFGELLASARGGAGDSVRAVVGERLELSSGRAVKPNTLVYGYDCERFRVDAGDDWRRRRLGGVALASVVVEPESVVADPLAGLTRDVDFAIEMGLSEPRRIRRAIRSAADDGAVGVGSARPPQESGPFVVAVEEVVSGNPTTVYYLSEGARRVLAMEYLATPRAKEIQAGVAQKVAEQATAPSPGFDYERLAHVVASSVSAALAPVLDRLLPATNAGMPLLTSGTHVPAAPEGYDFTQARAAHRLGLPEKGEGANLIGGWAREERIHGVPPWSTWVAHGTPDRLIEDAAVRYSQQFIDRIRPAADAAARAMGGAGYRIVGGELVAFDPEPTTKTECAKRMREAGLGALRRAS